MGKGNARERAPAKKGVRDVKEEWERTFDAVPDLIMILDGEQRVVRVNQAMAKRLGSRSEECVGRICYELVHGTTEPPPSCPHALLLEDETEHVSEFHEERLGGDFIVTVSPLRDAAGQLAGSVHVARDITERKRAERSLHWETEVNAALSTLYEPLVSPSTSIEEMARVVLEKSKGLTGSEHGFVSSIDPDNGDNVCHTMTEMLRGACDVSEPFRKIVFPRGGDGLYPMLWGHALNTREAFFTNAPRSHPASRGTPEGHIPIARFLSVPVMMGEELVGQIALANKADEYRRGDLETVGRVAELYALAIQRNRAEQALRNAYEEMELRVQQRTAELAKANQLLRVEISDRKRAEDALRESEAKYRIVADNTYDWEWWLNEEDQFVYVSPSCKRITGHEPGEFMFDRDLIFRILHPEDLPAFRIHLSGATRKLTSGEVEFRVVRPDGSIRWVAHACQPVFDADGRYLGRRASNRDVTERKRAEEQLRESETQLRALSTRLLTAQESERRTVAQEIHDSIGQILAAVKFKVEQVLHQTKRGKGKTSLLDGIVPLVQESIEEVRRIQMALRPPILDDLGILATIGWFCREFEKTYPSIRIQTRISVSEDEVTEPLKIVVFRVLQEALNNVAKHGHASLIQLSLTREDGAIALRVQDNGQGFDLKEALSRDPVERGLGLGGMRERVELSGGVFNVTSAKSEGTRLCARWGEPSPGGPGHD